MWCFIPKYLRKQLYGELRRYLGEVLRKLAEQKESRIEEEHLLLDHVHMMGIHSGLRGRTGSFGWLNESPWGRLAFGKDSATIQAIFMDEPI